MKNKRVLPPSILFSSIIVMFLLHLLIPGMKYISFPYNLGGVAPLLLGIVLNLAADSAFKRLGTTVKPFEESTALITNGVFRISRHPMYLGMLFILLGIAIFMGSLSPLIVVVLFPLLMEILYVRIEERMLEVKFGDDWRVYRNRVRRWI